jgi:hypothetical protein
MRWVTANDALTARRIVSAPGSAPIEGHSVLQQILDALPPSDERGRYRHVRVSLLGRYMLPDRREFPCQAIEASPGDVTLLAPIAGAAGDRVIAYIDHLGRLEGAILHTFPTGFVMTIATTPRKRDKLAAQLTWLANRRLLDDAAQHHQRAFARSIESTVTMPDGTVEPCRVVNVSVTGATVACGRSPAIGTLVVLGSIRGRVGHYVKDGFAIEFTRLQHPDGLEDRIAAPSMPRV